MRSTGPIIVPVPVIARETRIVPVMPVIVTPPMQPRVIVEPPEAVPVVEPDPPVSAVPPALKKTPEVPGGRSSKPALPEEVFSQPEEKSSQSEKTSSGKGKPAGSSKRKKLKFYSGKGRRYTEERIEEILDWYLQTGALPRIVSDRQRWNYRHHRKLPERRQLLEQAGKPIVVHEIGGHEANELPPGWSSVSGGKRTAGNL